MNNKHVKVALVGCGGVANVHAFSWLHIAGAKLIAVCDINEELGKEFQNKYSAEKFYSNYEDLLLDPSIELIDLCTPPKLHKEQIIKAFDSNKHVLVEKPLVMDMTEMEEVLDKFKKSNVKFCVVHNQRFERSIIDAKNKIENNEIGEVVGVDIFWQDTPKGDRFVRDKNNWCHNLPGGRWEEVMPHYIYLARYFVGEMQLENASLSGVLPDYPWMISSDANITLVGLRNPTFVNLRFTQRSNAGKQIIITIYGTDGHLYIERHRHAISEMKVKLYNQKYSALYIVNYNYYKSIFDKTKTKIPQSPFLGTTEQLRQYIDAILLNTPPPVPIDEAYDVMKLAREIGDCLNKKRLKEC